MQYFLWVCFKPLGIFWLNLITSKFLLLGHICHFSIEICFLVILMVVGIPSPTVNGLYIGGLIKIMENIVLAITTIALSPQLRTELRSLLQ